MKSKKFITKLALIGALILGGVSLTTKSYASSIQTNQSQIITLEEANKIALQQIKDGKILKSELEHKHGRTIYEIEILENNIEKEIRIDATNGNIIKFKDNHKKHNNMQHEMNSSNMPNHMNNKMPHAMNSEAKISIDEAKAIALKNSSNGTLKSIELKNKKGLPYYEIEISEGLLEKEFKIDAINGNILKVERDF